MTVAWFDWWWDPQLGLPRAQVITGLVGAALGIIAVVYAWRVARRQFKVMDEQTAISRNQEAMAVQQGEIARRQGEIAEAQHQLMQQQLARRMDLRVRSGQQYAQASTSGHYLLTVTLNVFNGGNAHADGFHCEIYRPMEYSGDVLFVDAMGNEVNVQWVPFGDEEQYDKVELHYSHRLFPGSYVPVARFTVPFEVGPAQLEEFIIKWRIHCEDGLVPSTGLAEIRYQKDEDGMYSDLHIDNLSGEGSLAEVEW